VIGQIEPGDGIRFLLAEQLQMLLENLMVHRSSLQPVG
jgi:hypothetical protein